MPMTCIFRFCSEITHSINRCRAETSLEALDHRYRTALVSAAGNGHTAVVKLFLDTANLERQSGDEALSRASYRGHSQVVKLLLNAGADVDAKKSNGEFSPLDLAAIEGHAEVVELLMNAGANLKRIGFFGRTRLCDVAARGKTEALKLLLNPGANAETKGKDGWTPLDLALQGGHTEVVKLLRSRRLSTIMEDREIS
jgi:uncharacterized protein